MAFAPEPYRSACLEVMYRAILEARMLAWGNDRLLQRLSKRRQERVAALMDAVHNIPRLMADWEHCNQTWLRDSLVAYDERFVRSDGVRLAEVYDKVVAGEDMYPLVTCP